MEVTINGVTRDISKFIDQHPGGSFVLQPFINRDATDVFQAFHSKEAYALLQTLPLAASGKQAAAAQGNEPALAGAAAAQQPQQPQVQPEGKQPASDFDGAVRQLRARLVAEGLFRGSPAYFLGYKLVELHLLLAAAVALLRWGALWWGAAVLGLFFQQAGWLSHDFLHQAVFRERRWNYLVGNWWLGSLLQGFSAAWWNEKHFRHHALPNGYLVGPGGEVVAFDKDVDTAPLVLWVPHLAYKVPAAYWTWVLPYQHLYTPALLVFSKLVWNAKSIRACWRLGQWGGLAAIAAHYAAFLALGTAAAGSLRLAAQWYAGGMAVGGFLLAFVFVQSHTATSELHGAKTGFYSAQMLTTRNISTDPLTTWLTGGLNYQIEHHLFPRLPRHSYPRVRTYVRALCAQHGIKYEELSLLDCTAVLLRHLRKMGRPKAV